MPDIFQRVDEIEPDKRSMVAERLEARASMSKFVAVRDDYLSKIELPTGGDILELGCGTGAVCRAIAERPDFRGSVTGSDLSVRLIEAARKITADAGVDGIDFVEADAQGSTMPADEFDLVLAHTVISHVGDPDAFLIEAMRLARPGGRVVVHDGDYASMTFDTGAPEYDRTLPGKYFDAIVANPFVMREMPRRLRRIGVRPSQVIGSVIIEAGTGEYFPSIIENYGPVAVAERCATEAEIAGWTAASRTALDENVFFGSCNFITYVFEKPS